QFRSPECAAPRRPSLVRTPPRCSSPGYDCGGAAFSLLRVSRLHSPVPARFGGVLLQFALFLRQSGRSAARLLFAPVPVSLVQRSHCAARENLPPARFPPVRG